MRGRSIRCHCHFCHQAGRILELIDAGEFLGVAFKCDSPTLLRTALWHSSRWMSVAKGSRVVLGGRRSDLGGRFYEPTILTNVHDGMRVFGEEIFGPVAPIFSFESEEQAIEIANNTEFGLACYFYSRDLGRVWRVSEALEYGIVGINEGIISNEMAPFGGIKESGQGREGSKYGLDDYLEIKYMCTGGIDN